MEVEALAEPPNAQMREVLDEMSKTGIKYLFGRWLIEGAPYVLLFDLGSAADRMDEWKGDLWSVAGIPSPPNDTETNDAILLGYLTTWFLGALAPKVGKKCRHGQTY
jgi:glycogen(starch) synthase